MTYSYTSTTHLSYSYTCPFLQWVSVHGSAWLQIAAFLFLFLLPHLAPLPSVASTSRVDSHPIPTSQCLPPVTFFPGRYVLGNLLTGTLPPSYANMKALDTLEMSHNLFSGPVPTFIGNFANLSTL